ncbi:MAG: metalloregulator ArsR/SmtB family transcription factor [Chlorobium sp.]|uniref:ArsR/SmtB family transcription factor n=1 Tax=Chlorobium sp. TaxID=1095 RepID=UPI0025C2524B|nr:metalloregulator ArsR/SmtB family transcription factor [Chlorobium sp.]MCF8216683.1 metalloregulator ArsR/SmtB family transcription factor [Chlorobium sp.]MCF8270856.1 metalloregulator ArsR/SmtB family transcription factor [Chlorobium sp.]MCF8287210.1 metalloregulator ArsR/SmtB family transcription factor [Chlorobium sp.]MCF8290868.1 metalloregulator ArsR/SmtB family transcription factor [Chlorobium sp.]MCF8385615.1 metalloregulator ArsR/SmtB family transcription factor [Chlorobium sp.]
MTEAGRITRLFKALSVETRVDMIDLLKHRSLCVNALAKSLGITPAAVSQHLRVLRNADLVIADRKGYFVHYRLNRDALARLRDDADRFFLHEEE